MTPARGKPVGIQLWPSSGVSAFLRQNGRGKHNNCTYPDSRFADKHISWVTFAVCMDKCVACDSTKCSAVRIVTAYLHADEFFR